MCLRKSDWLPREPHRGVTGVGRPVLKYASPFWLCCLNSRYSTAKMGYAAGLSGAFAYETRLANG